LSLLVYGRILDPEGSIHVSYLAKLGAEIDCVREIIRWRGPWRAAALVAREALRLVVAWQIYHVVEHNLELDVEESVAAEAGFPVKIFKLEHGVDRVVAELAPLLAHEPTEVAERLREGDAAMIAYHDNEVIGCCWAAFRRNVPLPLNTVWHIGPGEAVLYNSFVLPKWRGKRVHQSLDMAACADMREHGIRRVLGSMSALNPQTLSLAKRSGKQFVMKLFLVHVPLLGWTWRYATGRPLHAHFEAVLAPSDGERSRIHGPPDRGRPY
jgi:GNAT superfamily N-acetyltransferase